MLSICLFFKHLSLSMFINIMLIKKRVLCETFRLQRVIIPVATILREI